MMVETLHIGAFRSERLGERYRSFIFGRSALVESITIEIVMGYFFGALMFIDLFLLVYLQVLGMRIHRTMDERVTDKTLFTYGFSFSLIRFIFRFPIPFRMNWFIGNGYNLDSNVRSMIHKRNILVFVLLTTL